jgi:hypothetical protein
MKALSSQDSFLNDKRCFNLPFFEDKAIAVLSFLCSISGNKLNHYKAAKLMYLFDRETLLETGEPAFYGKYYSLPAGPIVSEVNNAIKSCLPDELDTDYDWKAYFTLDQERHLLSQKNPNTIYYSGLLNGEDEKRLTTLYKKFKNNDSFTQIKDFMHALPENIELQEGERRIPLTYRHILEKNGFSSAQIEELLSEIAYENLFRETISQVS